MQMNKKLLSIVGSVLAVGVLLIGGYLFNPAGEGADHSSLPTPAPTTEVSSVSSLPTATAAPTGVERVYRFRNKSLLDQHYEKHGKEMGFASVEEYEQAASRVINDPSALYKKEAEDGDDVYYIEKTNEFVICSTDGYIRTYFLPGAGRAYFDRQ